MRVLVLLSRRSNGNSINEIGVGLDGVVGRPVTYILMLSAFGVDPQLAAIPFFPAMIQIVQDCELPSVFVWVIAVLDVLGTIAGVARDHGFRPALNPLAMNQNLKFQAECPLCKSILNLFLDFKAQQKPFHGCRKGIEILKLRVVAYLFGCLCAFTKCGFRSGYSA